MDDKFSRRLLLLQLLLLTACRSRSIQGQSDRLVIGTVSYLEGQETLSQYDQFITYLGEKTQSLIELEPAFNENKALERIHNQAWALVFAPPGLAAIAISKEQYQPIFPLIGVSNLRSVLVVLKDSPLQNLKELSGKTVALGQPGSATGFYFPIYNLYGLTLAEIILAPTPKNVLELIAQGKAVAGAISQAEFNLYRSQFGATQFRILYTDPHNVPLGVVLISPTVERNRQEHIRKVMNEAPSVITQAAGYVPNTTVPDYRYMITVVERVRSIFADEIGQGANTLQLKPARLFK